MKRIQRKPFKVLTHGDIGYFKSIVDVIQDVDALDAYNKDWLKKYTGNSKLVLRPKTTLQVSQILKYCNQNNIAVVPQGGNTGLVGGSVPVHDEIILSLQAMNRITGFDPISGILECEAGCILQNLDDWLATKGYMMPLDLGAKGTCQIGGNISTNAGGIRLLRYGSLHGTVLSLDVTLADGSTMKLGNSLRKDNTGYDLKQLFIGAEGTLGVITNCTILTSPKPKATNVALLSVPSYENIIQVFKKGKLALGEILSAFEFFDKGSMQLVEKHLKLRNPMEEDGNFYVLIETSGSNNLHDEEKLSAFLDDVLNQNLIENGVLAQDNSQINQFWKIRESITEACSKEGANFKYDLSVPITNLYDLVNNTKKYLKDQGLYDENTGLVKRVVGFGHLGDGNLHLNIVADNWSQKVQNAIEPYIYEETQKFKGSISAEHGLGLMKAPYVGYSQSEANILMMKSLKNMFDPKGILNPYKYVQ